MKQNEAINKMIAPGQRRKGKWLDGVIQIHITRSCDKACFNCTQGSNYRGKTGFISLDNFDLACRSLRGYFGVVGVFGGNPALHPEFEKLCDIIAEHIPFRQRGIWCNNPITESKAKAMRRTFNPAYSNLNVHLDQHAYRKFKEWWPESKPFGLEKDSRHSPVYVDPQNLGAEVTESQQWELISRCDINQHWSAMLGEFRGELRAYFCEIAGAMSMLKQHDLNWPDTGMVVEDGWWRKPLTEFTDQVLQHCLHCAVPFKGYGELACSPDGKEQTSEFWKDIAQPKKKERDVEIVATLEDLKALSLTRTTNYLQNSEV